MIPSYVYICIFIYIHRFAFALVCVCVYHPWLSFFPTLSLKHFVCLIFCFPTFKGHMDFDRIPQTLARSTVATRQLDLPKDAWLRIGCALGQVGSCFHRRFHRFRRSPESWVYVNTRGFMATSTSAVEIGFQREVSIHGVRIASSSFQAWTEWTEYATDNLSRCKTNSDKLRRIIYSPSIFNSWWFYSELLPQLIIVVLPFNGRLHLLLDVVVNVWLGYVLFESFCLYQMYE